MIYGNFDDNLKEPSMRYTGVAEAMLESAQSDLNMFKAMLALDAYEIKLNEAAEGETDKESLKQKMQKAGQAASGAVSRIREAIATGLEKLGDVLYKAYGAIAMKVRQLLTKDIELASKGLKNVKQKNLDGVKLKWLKIKVDPFRLTYNAGITRFDPRKEYESKILSDGFFFETDNGKATTVEVDASSKLADISNFFSKGVYKQAGQFAKQAITIKRDLGKAAAEYRKKAKAAASSDTDAADANAEYTAFKKYRNMRTKEVAAIQSAMTKVIQMYRAALYNVLKKGTKKVKDAEQQTPAANTEQPAADTNQQSTAESAIFDIAVDEACCEVEDVMKGIIIGGDASEFYSVKPRLSAAQEHANLMQAMSAPIF